MRLLASFFESFFFSFDGKSNFDYFMGDNQRVVAKIIDDCCIKSLKIIGIDQC